MDTYKSTTSYNIPDKQSLKSKIVSTIGTILLTGTALTLLYINGIKEPKLDIRHTEGLPKGSMITHVYAPINGTVLEVIKCDGESSESTNLENGEWSLSSLFRIKYLPKHSKDSTGTKTENVRGQVIIKYDTLNKKLEK